MIDWSKPLEVRTVEGWSPVIKATAFTTTPRGQRRLLVYQYRNGTADILWTGAEADEGIRNTPSVEPVAYTAETFPKGLVWYRLAAWPQHDRSLVVNVHYGGIDIRNASRSYSGLARDRDAHLSEDNCRTWHRACANWRELEGKA